MQKQSRRLPPRDRLAAFDAAARHLSFTKAAAERFLTQSAVNRQIAAPHSRTWARCCSAVATARWT